MILVGMAVSYTWPSTIIATCVSTEYGDNGFGGIPKGYVIDHIITQTYLYILLRCEK